MNRFFLILAGIMVGCLFLVPKANAATWYNTAWGYRNLLTINASQVSTSSVTSSTYTNFTILVDLASSSQLHAAAQSTGTDILFTNSDGVSILNYEIENYVSSTGELEAWVKMPTVATSSNTQFYMYYGNPSATSSLQSATNTWDSNYLGVWHMASINGSTAINTKDSTAAANNGTITGGATSTVGQIDGAGHFNGTSQYISNTYLQQSSTAVTYEAWVNVPSSTTNVAVVIQNRGAAGSGHSLTLALDGDLACGSTSCGGTLGTIPSPTGKVMFGDDSANIWIGEEASTTKTSDGNWHYIVGTWSATSGVAISPSEFHVYVDGANTVNATSGNTGTDTSPLTGLASTTIGYHPAWAAYFTGGIDELRISKIVRPFAWIATEYNYAHSPSTFITVGTQETPPAFTQSAFRWFTNIASSSVGSPLDPQNTTTTAQLVTSSTFRLRMLIRVTGSQVNSSSQAFNLQYVDAGTGSCVSPSGGTPASYTNVSTSTGLFQYLNNAGVTDGVALVPTSTDPVDGTSTVVNETYDESNPFSNSQGAIAVGADGKWDFALQDDAAKVGETYCFRAVTASGTAFSSYAVYPTVVIGNVAPTVSGVTLNGNSDISLIIATTTLIQATATVNDGNGYTDIATTSAVIFRTSSGTSCTANNDDCYVVPSCSLSSCFGTSCTATCGAKIWYFAQPTDTGSPWASDTWSAAVTVSDFENATGTATSTGVDLLSLLGLQVASSINYGSLSPGSTTGSLNVPIYISNVGNVSLNTTVYGTNMTNGANSIPVGDQYYATSVLSFASGTALLANPGTTVMLAIPKTTSTVPAGSTLEWGIAAPYPQPSGNFNGVNTFVGVENSLPWP
jgi:hypothetical protein